jgi:hypothetical protein
MTMATSSSLKRILFASALPLSMLCGQAVAQTVSIEQLGSNDGISIEGEVRDVLGNRFVLEDDSGRILVETGPERGQEYNLRAGERLKVFGEPDRDGSSFEADRIVREDGTEIVISSENAARPDAGGAADNDVAGKPHVTQRRPGARMSGEDEMAEMLRAAGFTDIRFDERKGRHVEFDALDADGRAVEIGVFHDGTIKMIDVEDDRPARDAALAELLPADIVAMVEAFGIVDLREFDIKPNHVEIEGYDNNGLDIEVRLSSDGTILKIDIDDDLHAQPADFRYLLPEVVRAAIDERDIVDVREFEAKPRHFELEGYDSSGREIEMEIGHDGRIRKIEVDSRQAHISPAIGEGELLRAVEEGGYAYDGSVERKPRHFEVRAVNPEGEPVRLHVDFDGEIYREQLRR